jgi:uncharacterized protein YbjT (DUF2867 family)
MSKTFAIVESGKVVNIAVADEPLADNWIESNVAGIGWDYNGSNFIAPNDPFATAEEVRAERDRLLAASDWTQVLDAPVDRAAWAEYRQSLRDVPQQEGFPTDVAWPVKP